MKQIEVQIMGNAYLLVVPEGGHDRLMAAVQRVDSAMCQIRDAGKIRARERIAVLAALNLAFDLTEPAAGNAPAHPHHHAQPTDGQEPAPLSDSDQARLRALLARLDKALGGDGRLI